MNKEQAAFVQGHLGAVVAGLEEAMYAAMEDDYIAGEIAEVMSAIRGIRMTIAGELL